MWYKKYLIYYKIPSNTRIIFWTVLTVNFSEQCLPAAETQHLVKSRWKSILNICTKIGGILVKFWASLMQMRGYNLHILQTSTYTNTHTPSPSRSATLVFQIWLAAGWDYPVSTGLKAWFSCWCHCSRIQDGCMAGSLLHTAESRCPLLLNYGRWGPKVHVRILQMFTVEVLLLRVISKLISAFVCLSFCSSLIPMHSHTHTLQNSALGHF